MRNTAFGVLFNLVSTLVLVTFFCNQNLPLFDYSRNWGLNVTNEMKLGDLEICAEINSQKGNISPCDYLISHPECNSDGYFNYIKFFYCDCGNYRFFGYLILATWLIILFYLLGNTASDYFCCSLEKLSNLLKMSPTVAGVSLLPLGNGAPDVFASIAAFIGTGSGEVGLNSVLGGALFVTCVVVGVVSLFIAEKRVQIDRKCFIRDLFFFLFTIICLTLILVIGKVNIWGAIAFVSIYIFYALFVALNEIIQNKSRNSKLDCLTPLLPVVGEDGLSPELPHWIWNSNVAIYSDYVKGNIEDRQSGPLWGWTNQGMSNERSTFSCSKLWSLLEIPLDFPRRLTIPVVEEDRWSKIYAVSSAFLAPVLLSLLWNTKENVGFLSGKIAYIAGFSTGSILSLLAYLYTSTQHPPHRFLFPWVFGGFFMSIIWFYIIANELVSLLVSLGVIFGINPSILALTILAWGNSLGDLMSNTILAMNERNHGAQIAMSGCYAGPMFNTLVGLGASLVIGSWSMGSDPYVVPRDRGLFITIGFLAAGLIWSLVVLPRSDMRPNKILGVGLITIYLIFLFLQVINASGIMYST